MRCPYCMPREVFGRDFQFMDRSQLLSFEEITRIVSIVAEQGVSKIRLTGGEPLLRRELERLVEMIAGVAGVEDIALTTNGALLERHAGALARAGLQRVTVSLDALDQRVFASMSDSRFPLARVLSGIDAARDAGLAPVKINMVVRRGVNDHCVLAMAEHFRGRPEILRFIEYMDVGSTNGWRHEDVVPVADSLHAIGERWPLEPLAPTTPGEVAARYRYRDGGGEVGFIHSVSQPFCAGCTRARLSADGTLFTCLFATGGEDLLGLIRAGARDDQLRARLASVWEAREDRYSAARAEQLAAGPITAAKIEMSYIGG